jgi:hypothetical protein
VAHASLSIEDITKIVTLISAWQTKLTWSLLVDRIAIDLNIHITRQTLDTYPRIKAEYKARKQELRGNVPKNFIEFKQSEIDSFEAIQNLKSELKMVTKQRDQQLAFIRRIYKQTTAIPALTNLLKNLQKDISEE